MSNLRIRLETALGATMSLLMLCALPGIAEAKRPGGRHCAGGVCHRVMTLAQTDAEHGKLRHYKTSFYDNCKRDRFNPCGLTSSGEVFRADRPDNAASAVHPDGTILVVRNPGTGLAAVVRVNNFGPFRGDRKLDVSRATAERLGFARRGVASLEVMVVYTPTKQEAQYARKRRYDPVPGFIGGAASMASAYLRYADITLDQRIARRDAIACAIVKKRRAPRLKLLARTLSGNVTHLARN